MTPAIRAVLFDKDGTLIDFRATWLPAYEAIVRRLVDSDEVSRGPAAGGRRLRSAPADGSIRPLCWQPAPTSGLPRCGRGSWEHDDVAALARQGQPGVHAARGDLPGACDRSTGSVWGLRERGPRPGGVATNDSEAALVAQIERLQIGGTHRLLLRLRQRATAPSQGREMIGAFARALGLAGGGHLPWSATACTTWTWRAPAAPVSPSASLTGASPRARPLAPHADHVVASIAEIGSLLA